MEVTTSESILERLKKGTKAVSDSTLGKMLGVSQQSVSNARQQGKVPDSWIRIVAERFGLSTDWLFFGTGSMCRGDAIQITNSAHENNSELAMIPLVRAILSAGGGSFEVDDNVERYLPFEYHFLHSKGCIAQMVLMRVSGDSMNPEIQDRDIVLIDQSQTRFMANGIYAVGLQDMIYLKKINALPDKIILESINKDYMPISVAPCDMDSVRILGRAIWWCREAL